MDALDSILHDDRKGRISGHIWGGLDGAEETKRMSRRVTTQRQNII